MLFAFFFQPIYRLKRQIALDKQHESQLRAYLDHMTVLLLEKELLTCPTEEVKYIARARTIIILTQLNASRTGYVFTFLREAGLMSAQSSSVINLNKADLRGVQWQGARLSNWLCIRKVIPLRLNTEISKMPNDQ